MKELILYLLRNFTLLIPTVIKIVLVVFARTWNKEILLAIIEPNCYAFGYFLMFYKTDLILQKHVNLIELERIAFVKIDYISNSLYQKTIIPPILYYVC